MRTRLNKYASDIHLYGIFYTGLYAAGPTGHLVPTMLHTFYAYSPNLGEYIPS